MTRVSAAAGRLFVLNARRNGAAGRAEGRWEGMRQRVRFAMGYAGPISAALLVLVICVAATWRLEQSRAAALDLSARILDLQSGRTRP